MKRIFLLVLTTIALSGCVHPQVKFRKARLLDPTMDPAKTSGFQTSLNNEPTLRVEKGTTDIGGNVGASCPTCGG